LRGEKKSLLTAFTSFRARLLLLIFLIVVPALAIALYGNLQLRNLEKARLREKAVATSQLAASNQANFLKSTRQLLATLTQFPALLLNSNAAFSGMNFSNLRKLSPDYADFGLLELDGTVFCSADLTNAPAGLNQRAFFLRTVRTKKFAVGNFHINTNTGEHTLHVGYPVADERGELRRVLYASLKLSRLADGIAHLELPAGAVVTLFDQAGNVLARFPEGDHWIGRPMAELPAVRKIIGGNGGGFEMAGEDDIPRLYAASAVSDGEAPGMFASVEVPLTILFARANHALAHNCVLLAAAALVIWLIVWLYAKCFFLTPIASLAGTARRLAAGDFDARTPRVRGASELAQLGGALNEMADGVQERTAALVMANEALRAQIREREKAESRIREQEEERRKLEEQFLRSQRMESIGALAGGIAHDLNNALVPIMMGAQMLRESAGQTSEQGEILELISRSAQRCAEMVKQILSFARGTRGQSVSVPLRPLLNEMAKIARDTFPKIITVECRAPKDLWDVEGDATELHQMLMNLCVNARDAMPAGGRLTLGAENVPADSDWLKGRPPSDRVPHVRLKVVDNGCGIPREIRTRIFEPFFTTKGPDKGTGLGLSTVASLVQRYHGFMEIDSEEGSGSEFRIYLPALAVKPSEPKPEDNTPLPPGHGETILLADDEQMVLELAKTSLENYGYRVLTADNGLELIACFEAHSGDVKLLVTDTDMPFLDGISAVRTIRKKAPGLPIIVASATKQDLSDTPLMNLKHVATLSKPYDIKQLIRGVAAMLDARA
jgi:signal transduction histidine kinase/CheY-like chemotaxis protein